MAWRPGRGARSLIGAKYLFQPTVTTISLAPRPLVVFPASPGDAGKVPPMRSLLAISVVAPGDSWAAEGLCLSGAHAAARRAVIDGRKEERGKRKEREARSPSPSRLPRLPDVLCIGTPAPGARVCSRAVGHKPRGSSDATPTARSQARRKHLRRSRRNRCQLTTDRTASASGDHLGCPADSFCGTNRREGRMVDAGGHRAWQGGPTAAAPWPQPATMCSPDKPSPA